MRMESDKGAIIFLINRSYLIAFKVFLYTLRQAIEEAAEDIVVMTDDPAVADDPFVNAMADRIIAVDQKQLDRLKKINSSGINDKFRTEDYGAYWYLKFFIYEDFGYDYHIFLDADMLCMSNDFRFTELRFQSDFAATRTVGPVALEVHGIRDITPEIRSQCLQRIVALSEPVRRSKAINSGVLTIGSVMMGRGTVTGLIRTASETSFRLEQDAVWHYVGQRRDLSISQFPIWLNFPEYTKIVGKQNWQEHLLPRIRILHYNRHPKPWTRDRAKAGWLHRIWWRAFDESQPWSRAVIRNSRGYYRRKIRNGMRTIVGRLYGACVSFIIYAEYFAAS